MRVYDRDLIRGGHYGQRSCEPHLQAEHMAAPTNAAKREESSCQLGAVHTWHFSDVTARADDVSSLGERWGNRPAPGCGYLKILGAALKADGETRIVVSASRIRRRSAY